ncbi:MAG TPA: RnfABCDGE type electron transport complex subunit A [bacterium]|nr:RnfABCDGE type electron transport complex subunit A [bacterium]HPM46253.1 RnfABCDGE type electron transport complex subunit A [bacterium]HRQ69025.1 RnfABCDGE type electron transport complex subunit A [bacterium]
MDFYMKIMIGSILVNNIILAQFLGICPFLGVSNKVSTSVGMSAAVIFVMTLATTVTYLLYSRVLVPLHIEFMQTVGYILVIAALVQMVEIIMKKVSPPLYQALGVFLPLITTNCAVLGVAIIVIQKQFNLVTSVVFTIATALGFFLALVVFAGIREQLEMFEPPKAMKGAPLSLITAGLLSLAFMGFAGLV